MMLNSTWSACAGAAATSSGVDTGKTRERGVTVTVIDSGSGSASCPQAREWNSRGAVTRGVSVASTSPTKMVWSPPG